MKFKKQLSADLYHARDNSGFTQAQVAERVGISVRNYQYIEKGEIIPHGDTLLKLIYLFDLDIDHYRESLEMKKR